MRKHGKIDENQRLIVAALRDVGARVESTANIGNGFPDLVCLFRGELFLLEVKKDSKAKLTPEQEHSHMRWQSSHLAIVTSVDDALRAIGAIPGKEWKRGHAR